MADSVSDEAIAQFTSITGVSRREAAQYLAASSGSVENAVATYYAATDNAPDDAQDSDYADEEDDDDPAQPRSGGGRTLGDASGSVPASSSTAPTSSTSKKPTTQKKFATLGDFTSSSKSADDDDDDKQDLYAGGEKSGLSVQNPDDLKKRILEKANRNGPPVKDAPKKKSFFKGAGTTLGSDETPSQEVPAAPEAPAPAERVNRTLHFWSDGFSVDDGDLYRSDDPQNAELLELIRRGRAPLRIMNVLPGQEVDVELKEHKEKYVKPKKKYAPFGGSGNRLGSPTPDIGGAQTMPGAFEPTPAAAPRAQAAASNTVDESQPTVTIRVSLGSGTRLTSRFNTTQTVGDVYQFVQRAEPDSGRSWVLQTTFPSMELKDHQQVLGEMSELKRGGAVVQKFT
jgi:UBX domain-containing protein 1